MTAASGALEFRHSLLRDAAYQLQLPGDRARLHAFAVEALEGLHGGRAPEPPHLRPLVEGRPGGHPSDQVAEELAEPAERAAGWAAGGMSGLAARYWRRAAEHEERAYRPAAARRCRESLATRLESSARRCAAPGFRRWMRAILAPRRTCRTRPSRALAARAIGGWRG